MKILELSKKDKKWRHIALKLCGNKELADDIVQDMYLKLHDKEDLKDFYVVLKLLNYSNNLDQSIAQLINLPS